MVKLTLRISEELHEKLRWLAYKEKRSQHAILMEIICAALEEVNPPSGGDE